MVASKSARRGRPPKVVGDNRTPTEKILEIGEQLVASNGPHGFRLQDVASHLGVKAPAIYNHFASRDDLLIRLAEKLTTDAIQSAYLTRPGESSIATFRRFGRDLAAYWYTRPAGARLVLYEAANMGENMIFPMHNTPDLEALEQSRLMFKQGVKSGELRKIRYGYFRAVLWAGVAGLVVGPPALALGRRASSLATLKKEADDLVVRLLTPG